jgi:hypothetical protein
MKQPTRRMIETLVLAATTVCLIGHGGPLPTCYVRDGETRSYNVVGTCGPAGVVTVTWSSSNFCSVALTGDNVGLPSSGNLGDNLADGFDLCGAVNSDWDLVCGAYPPAATDGGASAAGTLTVGCFRRPSAGNPSPSATSVPWCQGELLPVTPTCNLHACPAVTCSSAEHTAFSASGCCPVCVANGQSDPVPATPPPVCHINTCPQSCPTGQEMFTPADACCGTCQAPSPACLDGRAQWLTEVTTRWSSARACTVDADCTITAVGSRCTSTCIDAIAPDQISTLSLWAGQRGNELCSSCITQGSTTCPANQSARPACNNGTCVMIGL